MMTPFHAKKRTVTIEFLYLDLEVCARCRGTDANLETALTAARGVLEAAVTPNSREKKRCTSVQ